MTDPTAEVEDDDDLGFFPSWSSLYWSVVIYTVISILVLYWLSVSLDFRAT